METKEIWKPIKGYEGYEVSNLGNVRSLNWKRTGKIKVLSERFSRNYKTVMLYKNGKGKCYYVHRLVAETFIPNLSNKPCVNHKDENTKNNNVENLEWCSYEYNNNYGNHNKNVVKSMINNVIISKQVIQFTKEGNFIKEWPSIHEAERNGFISTHISSCCRGIRKSHKGFIWKYK